MSESHTQTVLNSLSEAERAVFQSEFNRSRKDPTHGLLFCMILGFIGGQRFYLVAARKVGILERIWVTGRFWNPI